MKKAIILRTVLILSIIIMAIAAKGQTTSRTGNSSIHNSDYQNAIGLRAGETSGLTIKHRFESGNAFEGIISVWPYTLGVTGLYEKYVGLGGPGLNLYFGGGGHLNVGPMYRTYNVYYRGERYAYVDRTGGAAIGIDGILGIEYKFKPIPFAISADLKPFIESASGGYIFMSMDPSIGLKFTF